MVQRRPFTGARISSVLSKQNVGLMLDAAQWVQGHSLVVPQLADTDPVVKQQQYILLYNSTGQELAQFDALMLGAPEILPSENAFTPDLSNTPFNGSSLSPGGGDYHNWALALEPIADGQIGLAAISGLVLCPIFVPAGMSWCDRADVQYNVKQLQLKPQGRAKVLWKESGTSSMWALLSLDPAEYVTYPGKIVTADAQPGATNVSVQLWQNNASTGHTVTGVHFDWLTGTEKISIGKEVMIQWSPWEKIWRIILAECEAAAVP